MVICGDPHQVDLPDPSKSGLADAIRRLERVQGIAVVRFSAADVVRHPLVQKIVVAYERSDQRREETRERRYRDNTRSDNMRSDGRRNADAGQSAARSEDEPGGRASSE